MPIYHILQGNCCCRLWQKPSTPAAFVLEKCHADNTHDNRAELFNLVEDWTYIVESGQSTIRQVAPVTIVKLTSQQVSHRGRPPPAPNPTIRQEIIQRDGGRCCITGKPGRLWDPLVVQCILPVPYGWLEPDKPRIFDMLTAFFGPGYRDWWLSYAQDPSAYVCHDFNSYWLVTKSAALAFSRGLVKLDRRQPSMIQYHVRLDVNIGPEQPVQLNGEYPLLGDHSRKGIMTVDARFVGTHARLCKSFQLIELARKFALENASSARNEATSLQAQVCRKPSISKFRSVSDSILRLFGTILLTVWLSVPVRARIMGYRLLESFARHLYESETGFVQELPLGLYLKRACILDCLRNEHNAIQCIQRYTSIPVPKPLDFVTMSGKGEDAGEGYLLMSCIPGWPLYTCYEIMSDDDVAQIKAQIQDYVAQMRAIPNSTNTDKPICNTLGEPLRDHHIGAAGADRPVGPFVDEAAFNQVLRFPDDPGRKGHSIFFTHADLNPRNIIVQQEVQQNGKYGWRVSGIVDWETAGYYPEYWEYTKALYEEFRWPRRYAKMVHNLFSILGDYTRAWDVERRDKARGP